MKLLGVSPTVAKSTLSRDAKRKATIVADFSAGDGILLNYVLLNCFSCLPRYPKCGTLKRLVLSSRKFRICLYHWGNGV